MDTLIQRYCLSLLLLTTIATSAASNETSHEEPRVPRVSGRIVKLYSGTKPEPYFCTTEGFQGDPSNCAIFYRCVKERSGKFTIFRYQCAPGTVYDPDLETCNHPQSTRRSECGGTPKPTAESYHTTHINEINEAQSEVPRPISTKVPVYTEQTTLQNPTLSWILSTERQNIPTKVPWALTTHSTGSTSTYQPSTLNQAQTEYSVKTTSPSKTTQQSNSEYKDPCTADGFMGDSENCRKFYRCVGNQRGGFVKYEFSCSELTIWDDEIQGCNHPWAVKRSKCGRSLFYGDKSETQKPGSDSTDRPTTQEQVTNNGGYGYKSNKTIQQQQQISHGSKVTQTQTQISNSPEVIQNQTQINFGNNVKNIKNSKFKQNQTQINYGSAVSQTQTQINYGNKGIQTQLQIDHAKDSSQSQVQEIQQPDTTGQPTISTQNDNPIKNECSESGFMGDANDCKKFYRCVNNGRGAFTKFEYFCGDGTVWDPEIEACNHVWAVKNCGSKFPSKSTTEGYSATTTKSTEYYTNPTKTTQSYSSTSQVSDIDDEDDVGYGNQNNQETTTSTTTIKTSTTKLSSTTTKNSNETTECTSSGFIGDANDCKIFYRCVDNGNGGFTKYEFKCGDGTVWDSDIEACNHEWAVKNCGKSTSGNFHKEETTTKKENTIPPENILTTVTLVQITTQAPTQNDEYDTGYGSQNHKPSITTISTTKQPQEPENGMNNTCKSTGFMGDEIDCKKFYRCVDNGNGGYIRYEFTCGEGTVWDPKIEACNHAWAVEKCGGNSDTIESTDTSSQSTPTTGSSDTSSIHTTQVSKETDRPVSTSTTSTTSSSTTNFDINNKCSNSGFMGDSNDCKKFYRCVDNGDGSYTRYEFKCGEGTVWDPKIEACNHAWAVENCGGNSESTHETQQTTSQHAIIQNEEQENEYATPSYGGSETSQIASSTISSITTSTATGETIQCNNSGFMGDKNNCKKFYRCVDNGKGGYDRYEFQCGEGTVWDESIEVCNHAWNVKTCGTNMSSTTHFQNETTTQSIPSSIVSEDSQTQQSTEKTTTTEAHRESEVAGYECTQEGFFGNKNDCKKFYRCVDNGKGGLTKYEFTCGDGTSWNQDIQGCDHASPSRHCSSTSPVITSLEPSYLNDDMDTQTTTTTRATITTEETDSTLNQTTRKPQTFTGACKSEGFYANPSDCKKFYRCVANGDGSYKKYDFNCGKGTVWNQEIQACDHESADKTCSGTFTSQTNVTEFQAESTTIFYTTTKKQETTDKTEAEAIRSCTAEGFFAHPNNCKKFIRCVNNGDGGYTQYEFSCGDGTVWVQEIQACDHDNDVNTCVSQNGSTTTYKPPHTEAHSSSISDFSTESMPPNREDDEYDTGNSKEPSYDDTDHCTSEGYYGNKQDCRKFYRCVDNGNNGFTKYDFVCGDGTAWDSDLQTCNHINEVPSCSGSTQEGSGNFQSSTNKNQMETESSSSTTKATTSSESTGGSNSNSQDRCESEGYFGDSKDCKKFYRCVDNGKGGYTKYDFTCGDGTIWDQDITNCNHPQDVSNPSCDSNQGTNDTSSTTSTTTMSSSQTTSNTTESSSSSQGTSDCSQESTKRPANNNVTCDKAGYYANPNDCKKFYRCVDWDGDGKRFSVFHFECGEGTIWDPAIDTCNHEDSVYPQRDCSQNQSQNVGGETTTSDGTTSTTTASESTTQESTTSEQATTQQSTTSEQITTQQTTTEQFTNEPTTTQQSTTSEVTTTQKSTTSEPTTTQQSTTSQKQTTSEQTTTQQSTISEQTTTQESTTSTTQQSTTSESTTPQQSNQSKKTNEPTTTQQSITSEQTTTQPSTTEQMTTQESTTSEQMTTQPSTTEQMTTQESTTSEQTTTQQSTTTEQTTTQQSTTSEQTTTQQSTSEQTSAQPSTTEQMTTQESTTNEQTTTQQPTTSEQTTTQQTTEESTTTTEKTTEGTTTTDQTDQSTSQTPSTESQSTEDQSTTESSSTTEVSSLSDKECPKTEDDQYLLVCPTSFKRHPKYCNIFYQCIEDDETYEAKMATFKCPNNTIYDENQTQCVSEDKADKKCDGEIANKRRFKRLGLNYKDPILADKVKKSCSAAGYFSFEKNSECAKGFLKCERSKNGQLRGHVYQCPDKFIYWSISKRCERVESVRDCKQSSNDWTGRWNIPVERKNVATS